MNEICLVVCLWLSGGANYGIPSDDHMGASLSIEGHVGYQNIYLWGSYSQETSWRMSGQGAGDMNPYAFGLGYDQGTVFVEIGYGDPNLDINDNLTREVVTEQLRRNHVCQNWQAYCNFTEGGVANFDNTEYSLAAGMVLKVGIHTTISKNISVYGAVQSVQYQESLAGWDGDAKIHDWWQETNNISAYSLQVGMLWRFN